MKYFKTFLSLCLVVGTLLNSCETTDLDLRVSPNGLDSNAADPNNLLTNIQLEYATNLSELNNLSASLVRIDPFFCGEYFNCLPGSRLNGVWSRTYTGILTNLQSLEAQDAGTGDLAFQLAVAKTLYAHSLLLLVDYIGEAAFSQAGNASEFRTPLLDSGQEVYEGALQLLDEAYALFGNNPNTLGAFDLFYDEDLNKWRKIVG